MLHVMMDDGDMEVQMSFDKKETLVPVDDAQLFCFITGKSNPPILVLHGGPGLGHQYLLPQMANIGNLGSVIFYDQRGTGKSIGNNNDWQANPFQTYVHDVEQLRKKFGVKTLLAHSWGSILASFYALAYPEEIDKIIYLNPVPVSSADYLEFVKHRSQIVDLHKNELDAIRESQAFKQGDPKTVEKFYRIYFKNYFAKPELADTLSLTMSPQAAINNFKIYDLFYQYTLKNSFDPYEGLKKLNKKSLIVAGDKDVIPYHYVERLHKNIPASELVLIKNCGHFSYIDQPDILFRTIEDFLK